MCQLLGMNCNTPTDICFSFTGFQARGGLTDVHKDGWGIAFFEDKGVRLFLDSAPSYSSPIAELVSRYPIKSRNVVAHIRKATQGVVALENTHPFQREMAGRYWVFAHNGNLPEFFPEFKGSYRPVGTTDSERAFCVLLERVGALSTAAVNGRCDQGLSELFEALRLLCLDLGAKGEFNFLLSSGSVLFAHCSTKLSYILRKAPFGDAQLKDQDVSIDFQRHTTAKDRVAIVATLPLTENEVWTAFEPGTLALFRDGELVRTAATVAGVVTPPMPTPKL